MEATFFVVPLILLMRILGLHIELDQLDLNKATP